MRLAGDQIRHEGRDLEAEIHVPWRMRLIIQIIVFLEILISCNRRSAKLCFTWWANQTTRTLNGGPGGEERMGSSG